MTGIDRTTTNTGHEFHPILDLVPVMIGVVGLVAAGLAAASDGFDDVSVARLLVGSLFLGAVKVLMLLGHWTSRAARLPADTSTSWSTFGKVWPLRCWC